MKLPPYLAGFLSAVCLALLIGAAAPEPPVPQFTHAGTIDYIVDGDTLDVEFRRVIRIRLDECWAPESRTKDLEEKARGLAAKEHLVKLAPVGSDCMVTIPLDGKVITLERFLGSVSVNGQDLSQAQCAAGHATRERTQ